MRRRLIPFLREDRPLWGVCPGRIRERLVCWSIRQVAIVGRVHERILVNILHGIVVTVSLWTVTVTNHSRIVNEVHNPGQVNEIGDNRYQDPDRHDDCLQKNSSR